MINTEQKMGKPRRFATGDELVAEMKSYLEDAEQRGRFPSVAGFCVFADFGKTTYYECRNHYREAFEKADNMLEEAILSLNEKLNVRIIFYLKNKFGYKDVTEQNVNAKVEAQVVNLDNLTPDELRSIETLLKKANDPKPE